MDSRSDNSGFTPNGLRYDPQAPVAGQYIDRSTGRARSSVAVEKGIHLQTHGHHTHYMAKFYARGSSVAKQFTVGVHGTAVECIAQCRQWLEDMRAGMALLNVTADDGMDEKALNAEHIRNAVKIARQRLESELRAESQRLDAVVRSARADVAGVVERYGPVDDLVKERHKVFQWC